jgi:hypothetical protein
MGNAPGQTDDWIGKVGCHQKIVTIHKTFEEEVVNFLFTMNYPGKDGTSIENFLKFSEMWKDT